MDLFRGSSICCPATTWTPPWLQLFGPEVQCEPITTSNRSAGLRTACLVLLISQELAGANQIEEKSLRRTMLADNDLYREYGSPQGLPFCLDQRCASNSRWISLGRDGQRVGEIRRLGL